MIKVKLIHPGWLSAPTGANTVMNSLLDSKDQFSMHDINMTSLSLDTFNPRAFDEVGLQTPKTQWRLRIGKWLGDIAKKSRIITDLIIYLTALRPGKKIAKYYLNSNPDPDEIVFFHTYIPCYYYLKYRKLKQKVVLVCHTNGDNYKMLRIYYPLLGHSLIYKKMLKMEKYILHNADRINFVSNVSMNMFLSLHKEVSPDKVSFIYNGVKDELKAIRTRDADRIIELCCVASISKRKGQHYIIDALKKFNVEDMPPVHFTFVGDGADRPLLEKSVCQNGLEQYVTFVGISQNVDQYLINSDIFILPSEDEGLPMAIIEAMRASLPIVSTPVGGIPEMVENGENGVLIQPCSKDIYDLLYNISKYDWKTMGRNARQTFEEKFTVNKMVNEYAHLLKS